MSALIPGKLYKLKAGLGIGYPKEHFFCAIYEKGKDWGGETVELDKNSVLMYVKSFSFRDEEEIYDNVSGDITINYYRVKMNVFLLGEMFVQIDAAGSFSRGCNVNILEPV